MIAVASHLGQQCTCIFTLFGECINSKEEGRDQELIQSNITPDPGRHMGKWQTQGKNTYKIVKRSAFSQQVTTRLQRINMTV